MTYNGALVREKMKIYVYNYLEPLGKLVHPYYELHQEHVTILNGNDGSDGHYFSDLNGDYYIFKNAKDDIIGKMQYRKWLKNKNGELFSDQEIKDILNDDDIIFGRPLMWKHSLYVDYCLVHPKEDWEKLRGIIKMLYNAEEMFDMFFNSMNVLIPCNIYIANKEIIMDYYRWLFPILAMLTFEINKDILDKREFYQQRIFGYLAERLLGFYFLIVKPQIKIFFAEHNILEAMDFDKEKNFVSLTFPE